jgi:hypothetical protein
MMEGGDLLTITVLVLAHSPSIMSRPCLLRKQTMCYLLRI